ncbi:radical SAM additional 4Fe4S-binding domain protein [Desulfosporosinus orientis DSM 765]|uniref:Radical SAM additional 4Fe4S-binding domain protein n=2 Tax=Desulfosporosinus orientis TaxID=1563 RepID=G7W6T5_DESOD|nr:radical SAM additional 4Fe4S-binding domain protein [Desulfosporosinus orientis DSM 765]
MAARFAKLKDEWLLRGWTDIPWSLVNWRTGAFYRLRQDGFYVAQSCDGQTDFTSPVFLPRHRAWLQQFLTEGIAEECRQGEEPAPAQEYRQADHELIRGIQWAVTGRCNLNCRHCYMDAPSGQPGEIPFLEMKRLLDKFEQANITEVSLTGGEPFMRKDLLDLIRQLTARRIRLTDIYTNATLISDVMLQELQKLEVRPVFRISFDGCGRHDLMRGTAGVEAVVLDAIQRIRTAGFAVAVTTCLDKTNLDCLMPTYEQMKALDLYAWGIGRPQPVGCGRTMTTCLSLQEMVKPCEELLENWLADGRPFMIGLEAFYSGAKGGEGDGKQAVPVSRDFSAADYTCSSCRQWPYLAPDGKLMPCISYGDTPWSDRLPSLLETDFAAAWNDPALRFLLDMKKGDVLAHNSECSACPLLKQCGTGCRTSALIGSGDLLAKDTIACELWQGGYKKYFTGKAAAGEQAKGNQASMRGDKQQ